MVGIIFGGMLLIGIIEVVGLLLIGIIVIGLFIGIGLFIIGLFMIIWDLVECNKYSSIIVSIFWFICIENGNRYILKINFKKIFFEE